MPPPPRKRSPPLAWLAPALVAGSLAPLALIVYRAFTGKLGANPIATALNQLGLLALTLLVACLACTPLKIVFGVKWPLRIRRTLGLLAFAVAVTHFLTYALVDQGLALGAILRDVTKRPFITVGFFALVLLVPLALTSTKKSVARLGYARWKRIHRLVYAAGVLVVIHFVMRVKADTREPLIWGVIVGVLLAVRGVDRARAAMKEREKARLAMGG